MTMKSVSWNCVHIRSLLVNLVICQVHCIKKFSHYNYQGARRLSWFQDYCPTLLHYHATFLNYVVQGFTFMFLATFFWLSVKIIIPYRVATKSLFLTSSGVYPIMKLEMLLLSFWVLLLIIQEGLLLGPDSESVTCWMIHGISFCVRRWSPKSFLY